MNQKRQPVAEKSNALLTSYNLPPQGVPTEQNNSRLVRTEGWVIHQHELDRPVHDTTHTYPPVSQHNAQWMQGQEKKPTMQPLPTIQESPHSNPHQQPPTSNHLLPSSSQVGPRFEGYVSHPAAAVHVGQENKQFIIQPPDPRSGITTFWFTPTTTNIKLSTSGIRSSQSQVWRVCRSASSRSACQSGNQTFHRPTNILQPSW